jgi:prepilin signal peptidase PulO-like enzyme (type II secretory pathway)
MENQVPYTGLAIVAWIVLSITSAVLARRLVVAFLLGLLCSAAFVGYCMYYQGPVEGGGIPQAFSGALLVVGVFYFIRWIRGNLKRRNNVTTTNT